MQQAKGKKDRFMCYLAQSVSNTCDSQYRDEIRKIAKLLLEQEIKKKV